MRPWLVSAVLIACASEARAEYVVFRDGQRLAVTGYELLGDMYRLQLKGGTAEVPVADVLTIEPEETFTPVPVVEVSHEPFGDIIREAAKRYNVDADLITSVIAAESNFDAKAISRKDARGLMQLLPSTAARLGVKNVFDPRENIDAGTRYLSELLQLYKNDLALALAAYNAGPERVQQYGLHVPPFAETVSYVRRVKQTYSQRKSTPPERKPLGAVASSTAVPQNAKPRSPNGSIQ